MKRTHLLTLLLSLALPAMAQEVPPELLGAWRVDEASLQALRLPKECGSIGMIISANGDAEYISGELRYKAKLSAKREGSGFEVLSVPYENNGRPNCQGRSADYFFSNYSEKSHAEVEGPLLHHYLFGRSTPVFLVFRRR